MNGAGAQGGMPGAGGQGGGAAAFPSPAGYTAELSYIHAMVEELSRQLSDNKRVLDDVVTGVGHVRTRAQTQQIGNEELIAGASEELTGQQKNLDATISALEEELDMAKYGKEANAQLLNSFATSLASMLKQFHEYKQKHVADVSAWHRSYRHQLAEARAENSRLRDQLWQMQESAGRANANLRAFRQAYDENPERWERRVADKAARQEIRFWKRMAMPSLSDETNLTSDSALGSDYWSDDDDLIDSTEKVRLREVERKVAEDQLAQQAQQQAQQQQLVEQQRALRYQQQQREEQQKKEQEFREMQAQQYYQAQQQQQQQQQQLQQQRQLERSSAAPTSTASAPLAAPTTGDLVQGLNGLSLGRGTDGSEDDEDDDTKSVILINDTNGEGQGDADDTEEATEQELSDYPPAVPEAPSSAPAPASIGLMERAVASLGAETTPTDDNEDDSDGTEDSEGSESEENVKAEGGNDDKDDTEEKIDPATLERPGSAASDDSSSSDSSTGSMQSTESDEL